MHPTIGGRRPKVWGQRSARERRGSENVVEDRELLLFLTPKGNSMRYIQTSTRKVSVLRCRNRSADHQRCQTAENHVLREFSSRTHRVKSRLKPRLVTNGSQHSLLKLLRKSYWPTLASCESSRRALARPTRSMRMCWPNSSHAT